jgi:hypothetical protein
MMLLEKEITLELASTRFVQESFQETIRKSKTYVYPAIIWDKRLHCS